MAHIDEHGKEVLSNVPLAIPAGLKQPSSIREMIQALIRHELSDVAKNADAETFEEADDFHVDDDDTLPSTPYEVDDRPATAPLSDLDKKIILPVPAPGQAPADDPQHGKDQQAAT